MTKDLPDSWAKTEFEEVIVETFYGPRFSKNDYSVEGVPTIRTTDFSEDGSISLIDTPRVDVDLEKYPRFALRNGDILVTRSGSIGKCASYSESLGPAIPSAYLIRVRVDGRLVESSFALTFLRSPAGQNRLLGASTAVTQSNVNSKSIRRMEFPLPPLNEQRRIVAKIEDLTARSRAAKQALDAIPPLLERFRQSVLAAAFRGDLTKQWRQQNPNTEPATELLKRIRQERRHRWEQDYLEKQKAKGKQPTNDKWKAKYQEPEPVDTTDLPDLPEGWCWATMQELSDFDSNAICAGPFGTIFKAKDFRDEGVPIIFLRHVTPGECKLDYKPGFMDREKWEEIFQPYSVYGGELLVTKLGDPPGISAIFPPERAPAMVTPDVIKMEPEPTTALNVFLMHYLNSDQARKFTFGASYGVTRLRMNLTIFRQMPVPLAPFEEQKVLAETVDSHLASIKQVSEKVEAGFTRLESLNQSILAKAFRGELVPQDPNDEPAFTLLERIRNEHQPNEKNKPRKSASGPIPS